MQKLKTEVGESDKTHLIWFVNLHILVQGVNVLLFWFSMLTENQKVGGLLHLQFDWGC